MVSAELSWYVAVLPAAPKVNGRSIATPTLKVLAPELANILNTLVVPVTVTPVGIVKLPYKLTAPLPRVPEKPVRSRFNSRVLLKFTVSVPVVTLNDGHDDSPVS